MRVRDLSVRFLLLGNLLYPFLPFSSLSVLCSLLFNFTIFCTFLLAYNFGRRALNRYIYIFIAVTFVFAFSEYLKICFCWFGSFDGFKPNAEHQLYY